MKFSKGDWVIFKTYSWGSKVALTGRVMGVDRKPKANFHHTWVPQELTTYDCKYTSIIRKLTDDEVFKLIMEN